MLFLFFIEINVYIFLKLKNIMKRKIILRSHQFKCADYVMGSNKCVLALAPNGGKTEISIYCIEAYLKIFPNHRVLVLTHSTNVLLSNYRDRLDSLDVNFNYSDSFDIKKNVHICIPANQHKIKGEYDFIIVDEAHENYLADRVQAIILNCKPSKQLLLTGTPSKFIYEGGYDIFAIAMDELDEQYFSKLNIELIASNYNIQPSDYNFDDIVKPSYKFGIDETIKTMESVVLSLIKRLDSRLSPEQFNDPSIITKVKTFIKTKGSELLPWASTFKSIGKTLFVCNNIAQAELVQLILINNGVNSVASNSKNDKNGENITNFKNGEHDVLVVVDRCRIGFDDITLMNLIDMSGTHNINLIYQMMCRVIRGTPLMTKYYIKITTNDLIQMGADEIYVSGALMLTNKEFLLKYNGKNFNDLEIPIFNLIRKKYTINPNKTTTITKSNRNVSLPNIGYDVIKLLRDIKHDLNKVASIYKVTTINEVKKKLGLVSNTKNMTYSEILNLAKSGEYN